MEKKKKSIKIFGFGLLSQVVTLILGIVIPKLVIVSYGSEINGLLSSVRQVFVYIALLEAGIGTASLQALYQPVANGNREQTSAIMSATDHYYRKTGILYGLAVVLFSIVYPLVVNTEIDSLIVVAVILLQGASGVINYFFQGKYTILLRVDGKSYITTNVTTIVSTATKLIQIGLMLNGFNIIAVQAAYFTINFLQMLYITLYVKKHYEWLDLNVEPNYSALSQSKNVIIHQVSGLIFNNTDILVLTAFCGLKIVSVYSLYSLIISCVSNIIDTICSSVEFALGQAFNSDRDHFLLLQEVYETYYLAISFAFFSITLIMFPAFIQIYAKGITDVNYVDDYLPILFVTLNVLLYSRRTSSQIINFAGHFKQTQWRSVIESIINLSVSLILVKRIGIYGVLIGTIVALIYRTNDIIIYANMTILGRSPLKTYRRWGHNLIIMIIVYGASQLLLPQIEDYVHWMGYSTVVAVACLSLFFISDSLADKDSFLYLQTVLRACIDKLKSKHN